MIPVVDNVTGQIVNARDRLNCSSNARTTNDSQLQRRRWALRRRRVHVKSEDKTPLNRREFNGLCLTLGSFVAASGAAGLEADGGISSTDVRRTVTFRDGSAV